MERSHTTFCALRDASGSSFEFLRCRSMNAVPANADRKVPQRQTIDNILTNSDIFRNEPAIRKSRLIKVPSKDGVIATFCSHWRTIKKMKTENVAHFSLVGELVVLRGFPRVLGLLQVLLQRACPALVCSGSSSGWGAAACHGLGGAASRLVLLCGLCVQVRPQQSDGGACNSITP